MPVDVKPDPALFQAYKNSQDPELREQIFQQFMPLVSSIVRKFQGLGEEAEDLVQVGYIGLLKAIDRFEPNRGLEFSTYATHCIIGELRHYSRDKVESIRKPRWFKRLSLFLAEYIENILQEKQRLPSVPEIAKDLNIAEEGVLELLRMKNVISLEGEVSVSEDAIKKVRSLRYETFRLPLEDHIVLMQAMEKLKEIEKKVVYMLFEMDLTQTQVAEKIGISQKKVSRLLKHSLVKLKEIMTKEL